MNITKMFANEYYAIGKGTKRDKAFELVDNGTVSSEQMMLMALSYMSADDVEDMLDANELSDRFMGGEDE